MAGEDPTQGFKVVDRRVTASTEEAAKPAAPKAPAAQASGAAGVKPPEQPVEGPGWQMREEKAEKALPPMDFTTFCLSLASSAMIHLGLAPNPDTGAAETNLPLAKQTIDILALLEEKTRNNLTSEESKLLGALLYDLRMRFVSLRGQSAAGDKPPPYSPK